jgi:hypothetical protein
MSDPVLPVTVILKVVAVKSSAMEWILPFLFSLVAREFWILEDFAATCRDNRMVLFGISSELT